MVTGHVNPEKITWMDKNKAEFQLTTTSGYKVNCHLTLPLPTDQAPLKSKPRFIEALENGKQITISGFRKNGIVYSQIWHNS